MAVSDDLKNKKNKYVDCLNNAIATANNLQTAINILNSVSNVQNSCYKVDETAADGGYLSNLMAKERKIYSNIIDNIIPGTMSIINNLDYQIADAEAQEALEAEA